MDREPTPFDPPNWEVFNVGIRCAGDSRHSVAVGDVIFQDRAVSGIPYPSGFWVLCRKGRASCYVAFMSSNKRLGMYAIDNWYKISTEDLGSFIWTGNVAAVPSPSDEGLWQDCDL